MTPLKAKILRHIRDRGPIGVADYMQIALMDPEHGYYMKADPIARDFITAPEVSQIFGEMIGLFFVQVWEDRGQPRRFHFVELGPGRGTLMADMLRAARKARPAFVEAAQVILMEASPALRTVQARTLKDVRVRWAQDLEAVNDRAPVFIVANEFFDALPVHQFVRSANGWHLRVVVAEEDTLHFALAPDAEDFDVAVAAPLGSVLEVAVEAKAAIRTVAEQFSHRDGAALIIDYGHVESGLGDTFQAMRRHAYVDPLAEPGDADLTFHVDFAALAATAREAHVFGPITQRDFLSALGFDIRAERLKRAAPDHAAEIDAAVDRLTHPDQMGTLFKVMGIAPRSSPPLPGFPC